MRLTALYVCGTLLAVSSLSWTTVDSDEGNVQEDIGFGPCVATLRPEGPCRQGQDESTCPYLFSLPPLEFHLPKQLRELEKIVKDLQKLKDNVDQLRKMCADCTVSQNERECGRQRENEKLNEGSDIHREDRNRLNERHPEKLKDPSQKCGKDRVAGDTIKGQGATDSEKGDIFEEKERKKWEAERKNEKGVVKENKNAETRKEVSGKDGKTHTEGAKGKDKLEQDEVPTAGENEKTVDTVRKNVVEKNNRERETDRNKEKDVTVYSNQEDIFENEKEKKNKSKTKNKEKTEESDHPVWRDERKETEKKTQTEKDRGSDGIKMSEDHDKHTNKEREKHGEERKKEMEKGIKVERNNEKPKQTESIGRAEKERTIKEGEAEEDREKGKEIKTDGEKTVQSVQRDTDGESATSKAFERTDFVSITPTPHSAISLAPRHDSMNSNKAITFTTSLPSPPLSSMMSHWITGVSQGITTTADGLLTQSTGLEAAGISEHPIPDVEAGFRSTRRPTTSTISTLGGPRRDITRATTRLTPLTSSRPGAGPQGKVSSNTATTTTSPLYTISLPGVTDRSRWTAKKNISSSTMTDTKPPPGGGVKPGKPAIKPEADRKNKNPKNDSKPDRSSLPDKKTKHDQKQRPSHQKPTIDQKYKPGKELKSAQTPKPDQRPDHLPTDRNLKNSQIPKPDQEHTTDQTQLPFKKPKTYQNSMFPVQRSTSQPRPRTVNTTGSDKDPLTDQDNKSVEIQQSNQNSKPERKPVHPLKADKPDPKQKPHKELKTEEKPKLNQRPSLNQDFTSVQEPKPDRSERTSLTPIPDLKPETHLTDNSNVNTSPKSKSAQDSSSEQKLTPDHALTKPPDHKSKPSQKIPKTNQKLNPGHKHPDLTTGQNTKPNEKPKPDQTSQTNPGLKTSQPIQNPNVNSKSVPDEIPEAESDKTSTVRHRPTDRNRPAAGPSDQRPKPSGQLRPSPNTKTNVDPFQISRTDLDGIQNSQTNRPTVSVTLKQFVDVTHTLGHTESSPSEKKTITPGPKTSDSLETGPFPHQQTVPGTTNSNSRITSDLRSETVSKPTLIPMTTTPNKIMRGILPSVVPGTSPGPTMPKQVSNSDPSLQAEIFQKVEETAPRQTPVTGKTMTPVQSASVQTSSTTSPDLRSTNPTTSGPEPLAPEVSTPSARELRVKINQVAAFFNNSLSPNGRPQDKHHMEHPEDTQGRSRPDRPDSKRPTLIPSEGTFVKRDCSDHLISGVTRSGVYLVTPDLRSKSFPVLCDMKLGGGGWTLLQRRQDGSVNFNRTWAEYRSGFGELDGGEFWLGNNMIHLLTQNREMMLRVELEDFDGVMKYAEYEQFKVASERLRYRLNIGRYSGTAGDALRFSRSYDHNNRAFTTPDRDHDRYPSGNCGAYYSSGWWFDACMAANLNGRYYVGKYKGVRDGIFWGTWHNISTEYYPTNDRQSFKTVKMMIRPKGFTP